MDWFKTSNQLCLDLTEALEEALGVEEGRLGGYLEASKEHEEEMKYGRMKVIRYPVDENVDGTQRLGKDQGGNQGVGAHKGVYKASSKDMSERRDESSFPAFLPFPPPTRWRMANSTINVISPRSRSSRLQRQLDLR